MSRPPWQSQTYDHPPVLKSFTNVSKLVIYSPKELLLDATFDELMDRFSERSVPHGVQRGPAPQEWGAPVEYKNCQFRRPQTLTPTTVQNLVESNAQTALILETDEYAFRTTAEGNVKSSETCAEEVIVFRGSQQEINQLLEDVLRS